MSGICFVRLSYAGQLKLVGIQEEPAWDTETRPALDIWVRCVSISPPRICYDILRAL